VDVVDELRLDSEVRPMIGLGEVERPGETASDEEVSAEEGLSQYWLSGLTGGAAGSPDASFGKSCAVIFACLSSTGFTWVMLVSTTLKVLNNIIRHRELGKIKASSG
jgi:hypothetical protein